MQAQAGPHFSEDVGLRHEIPSLALELMAIVSYKKRDRDIFPKGYDLSQVSYYTTQGHIFRNSWAARIDL